MCIDFKVDGFYCATRKDSRVGGWCPGNPYSVRIEKSVRIIGPSLTGIRQLTQRTYF